MSPKSVLKVLLAITSLTLAQRCQVGYFRSTDDLTCNPCASDCIDCYNKADQCTICKNQFMVPNSEGKGCKFCPLGQFIGDENTCQDCIANETCEICFGKDKCLQCKKGYSLSLVDHRCYLSNCSENLVRIEFGDQVFCREPKNYYIDGNSTAPYEFGTKQFPFKRPFWAVSEIYHFRDALKDSINILLKKGSVNQLHAISEPLMFIGVKDIKIKPYSDDSEDIKKLQLKDKPAIHTTPDKAPESNSLLNPWASAQQIKSYDKEMKVKKGLLTEDESKTSFLKFIFARASVTLENLQIIEVKKTDDPYNAMFQLFYSPDNEVVLSKSYAEIYRVIIYSQTGYGLQAIIDSHVKIMELNQGFIQANSIVRCGGYQKHGVLIKNSTIEKMIYDANFSPIFYMLGPGNYTLDGNHILNFQQPSQRGILEMLNNNGCANHGTHSVTITNNFWEGKLDQPSSGSFFTTNSESLESPGIWTYKMSGNVFKNILFQTQMFQIESIKPWKSLEISNNHFINFQYPLGAPLYFVKALSSNLIAKNNTFENSKIDQVFYFEVNEALVENLKFKGMKSNNLGVDGMIEVRASKKSKITELSFENCELTQPLFFAQDVDELEVQNFFLIGGSLQKSAFIINDVRKSNFNHFKILDSFNFGSEMSFFDFALIDSRLGKDVNANIQDFEIENTNFSFLQVQQVLVSNLSKAIRLNISNFRVKNFQSKSNQPIIYLKDFLYNDFQINFIDGQVENIVLAAPFFRGICNSKVFFNNLQVKNSKMKIVSLEPFSTSNSETPLEVEIRNSMFLDNFSYDDAAFVCKTNSITKIYDSVFEGNYNLGRGGVVLADQIGSQIYFYNSVFKRNYAIQGGVAYAQGKSLAYFDKCIFEQNFAINGGVIYVSTYGRSSINNSKLIKNSALRGQIVFIINSSFENLFKNLELDENLQNFDTNSFNKEYLSIALKQPEFKNKFNPSQPFLVERGSILFSGIFSVKGQENLISISASSLLKFQDVLIEKSQLNQILKCVSSSVKADIIKVKEVRQDQNSQFYLFDFTANSEVELKGLEIHDVNERILYSDNSQIVVKQSLFHDIISDISADPYIYIRFGSLEVESVKFQNIQAQGRTLIQSSDNKIQFSIIEALNLDLTVLKATQVEANLKGLEFKNFKTQQNQQSAIELQRSRVNIQHSRFQNFENFKSLSAIQTSSAVESKKVVIKNSNFTNLSSDKGGAIFIRNQDIQIVNSTFENNLSSDKGGAIFLSCQESFFPTCDFEISENAFIKNKALKDGGAISFDLYPFNVKKENTFEMNEASSGYGHDFSSYPFSLRLNRFPSDISSGQSLKEPYFVVDIVDFHGQKIVTESENQVLAGSAVQSASLSGFFLEQIKEGQVTFKDFVVLSEPKSEVQIEFSSSILEKEKIQKATKQPFKDLKFTFNLVDCKAGEILKDNKCIVCTKGSYQLVAKQPTCLFCPENFSCAGGNALSVDQGYWRSNTETNKVYSCLEEEACLGGFDSQCKLGYKGMICSECIGYHEGDFYSRSGKYGCQKCEKNSKIAVKLVGILILIIIYISVLVTIIILSANRNQQNSVLVRIMTNYFQIILMARNLDIVWPERVEKLLESISFISSAQEDMLQLSCFFKGHTTSPYFISTVSLALLPFLIAAIGRGFWWILSRCLPSRFKKTWKRNSITTAFVVAYLIYPSISNSVFQGFNCSEVDGKSYLKADIGLECYSSRHYQIIFILLFPCFLVWIVGFPIMTFLILYRKRFQLDDRQNVIKYGLFYIGLTDQAYYWEVVVNNIRKLTVAAISVAFGSSQGHLQLMLIFSYLYVNHQLIKMIKPYQEPYVNQIDLQSSFASISAILLGVMFLRGNSARSTVEMEIVFWALLLVNLVFMLRWAKAISMIYVTKLQTKILQETTKPRVVRMAEGFHYQRKDFMQEANRKRDEESKLEKQKNQAVKKIMEQSTRGHIPKRLKEDGLEKVFQDMQEPKNSRTLKSKNTQKEDCDQLHAFQGTLSSKQQYQTSKFVLQSKSSIHSPNKLQSKITKLNDKKDVQEGA